MKVSLSFDYDSPAGYRESFHMRHADPFADVRGTEALLQVLSRHGVRATFAFVGEASLAGTPPERCRYQIRQVHAAGHEIASHSMHHRFIPPMTRGELLSDLSESKRVLEECIGAAVTGFVPPFNRPMHFPRYCAPSFSEMLGLHGRGRGRQSITSLLRILRVAGFQWCRVSFSNKLQLALEKARLWQEQFPRQPFVHGGIVALPLHATGFGAVACSLVRRFLDTDLSITLYGHPNQALEPKAESAASLDQLLTRFREERSHGRLEFYPMGEIAAFGGAARFLPKTHSFWRPDVRLPDARSGRNT